MDMHARAATTSPPGEEWPGCGDNWNVAIEARIASQDETAAERRRADRAPVSVEARVRPLGAEGCEARLLNVSETGFMAETAAEFEVGARVWLILPGRERANALVRWSEGKRIGAEFAEPIDTAGLLGR